MVAAQKMREETAVVVGLQLESGDRLLGDFLPTESLWNVIKKLCPSEADLDSHPVIIYMRREVSGVKALEGTTLRSLGLTGGRAMLRFVHRTPEELHHQANVSGPLPKKSVSNVPQEHEPESNDPPEHASSRKSSLLDPGHSSVAGSDLLQSSTFACIPVLPSSGASGSAVDIHGNGNQNPNSSTAVPTGSISSPLSVSKVSAQQKEGMDIDSLESVSVERNELAAGSSKATIAPLPECKESNEEVILLGERNAIAFSLEMAHAVPFEDLPDDFFELTLEDARAIYRDLKRRRDEMEEAPFVTNAQRSLEESKRVLSQLNQYRQTVIRIHFPDRTVLQGTFFPLETIKAVMNFIRGHLENPDIEFHLYTTPPKNILTPEMRLIEAGCVPNTIVHFGTKNHASFDSKTYLREAILTQFTSPSAATLAACQSRAIEPGVPAASFSTPAHLSQSGSISHLEGKTSEVEQPMNIDSGPSSSIQVPQRENGAPSNKIPKWFKSTK
ncbi:hypothetical protein B7P43_G13793 [Cryptotermes secundus]|nr:hypothetical protein B7P43_G13793 [Cryptotermes secundus]